MSPTTLLEDSVEGAETKVVIGGRRRGVGGESRMEEVEEGGWGDG